MEMKCTKLEDAIKAVKEKGDNIQYCIPELVANIEVLKEAVKNNYFSMQKIQTVMMPDNSGLVINNKKLMFDLIKVEPRIFIYLGDKLKDDEEIATYCVSSSRYAYLLKYAGKKVKANRNIVLKAVTNTIYAVDTAFNDEIKNDKEIALKILGYRNSRINLTWFGDALKSEINNALGYDITEKPIDLDVIADVEKYLKTKLQESKEKEQKKEVKPVVKEEVKETKIEPVIDNTTLEKNKEVEKKEQIDLNKIENEILNDSVMLNNLFILLQSKQQEVDDIKARLSNVEKDIDTIKNDLRDYSNKLKQKVLNLKKN